MVGDSPDGLSASASPDGIPESALRSWDSEAADSRHAGLYVHVPFCSSICPYCDFAVARGSSEDRARYVRALLLEIKRNAKAAPASEWTFDTIYFGGGTPSALTIEQLGEILDAIDDAFDVRSPRIFLEANPEDVDSTAVAGWRSLGVETLSLGVQSFDDRELRSLGRLHRRDGAERSVALATQSGFSTVSVDLIYGLPKQSISALRDNFDLALDLGADHLSCYQLTFHEGTPFGRALDGGKMHELPEHDQADFFAETHRYLRDRCPPYEVSNFARSAEHQSRHNRKYWDHTPYLGLGPSAHSYGNRRRSWNEREWRRYAERLEGGQPATAGHEDLTDAQLALEVVMLGLRTVAGIDLVEFSRRFGIDLAEQNAPFLSREPRLTVVDGRLRCTADGLAIADGLAASISLA